ncbi:tetratricopeptide repeat protein [Streptomyces rubradiris]|nr:tetratricopeptide repeat protein [Streptomyces rubradiris]GHH17863.1 Tat pathway signal protein [Streptomyces rubradiris]
MTERRPNEGLKRLLAEAGWTLGQLATAVNRAGGEAGVSVRSDKSNVSKWLGGHTPVEKVRPLILEALSRRLGRQITHAEAGLPVPHGVPSPSSTVEGLVDLGRTDMDPSRRSVLGAGLYSVALTIPGWPDVVGRAEAVKSGKGLRIGSGEVDMVIQMTEKLSDLDDQFGGRTARPMAASFLVNTVAPCLRADAPEDVRKAMLSAASDLCYLTGYMAVDEGLHGLAQKYYLKALELAGAAEDHLTYCTTLRGMSVQAIDLGHGRRAMELADAAATAAPKAGPRMLAFLTGQQAHSAAQIGDRATALRRIREAEAAMDRAESRGKTFGSYDPATLHYHIAQVRYELGDVAGSVAAMRTSNQLRHSHYRRTTVRFHAIQAERQLQMGHLEEALTSWNRALDDYPLVRSGRADARFRNMRKLIKPHLRHPGAAELYERAQQVKPAAV